MLCCARDLSALLLLLAPSLAGPSVPAASGAPSTLDPIELDAYLKASNSEALDEFGLSVALWGNTLVIGAPREDSSATGIDGDQSDNGATLCGAAYVFVRDGFGWVQ
jgi:hypothetical protein